MAKRPLEIDMCSSSQLRDTQGEMLNVEGADITELLMGRGRLNDNHGKGFFNCLGKVTAAKKIFKAEDCDDDRQRYYWNKVKSPYIYVKGELFDDEDHPNAKAAAAILRNIHKTDCPLKIKASVEGGVISRGLSDPALLARTKIHSIALTFVPANQATLVEPLNLDKSEWDMEADEILIKSVLHLAESNVPSFRHIIRDASAEKIENNINQIMAAFGAEATVSLKQELIKDSLKSKIFENVVRINEMVHTEVERMDKSSLTGALAGVALMTAIPAVATPPFAPSAVPEHHQELYKKVAQEEPILGAIGFVESSGAQNYNHEKDNKGWAAGGMFGMRPAAAQLVLRIHPELAEKYPELAKASRDLDRNHAILTKRFNDDPEAAVDFAKALLDTHKSNTRGVKMLIYSWNHGVKGSWDLYKSEGSTAIDNDEYVQKVLKAFKNIKLGMLSKNDEDEEEMDKKELDPSLGYKFTHEHHDLGDGDMITHVKVHHPDGTVVGEAAMEYNHKSPSMKPDVSVHPSFRRQGIATAMYNHAQKLVNKPVAPSSAQSNDAKALWAGTKGSFGKSLTAGYGGAGAPGAMSGGAVLQSEALGPKSLKYITCDNCGKEQVYGKFQVKCREPECGKAFSMNKLEKFFRLSKG